MSAIVSKTAPQVVNGYLSAFYRGDFETAAELLADDFSFEGPFVKVDGKDAFLASAQGLRGIVRGHRLLRSWHDGDEICSIFELDVETPKGSAAIPMCEWHSVRDDEIIAGRVLFDSAAMRELLPTP